MRINIVTVKSGWILQKIAERIWKAGNETGLAAFYLSHSPMADVDANFYCDVTNCYRGPSRIFDIGLFTHVENNMTHVPSHAHTMDFIFHMAERYKELFWRNNVLPESLMNIMIPWEIPEDSFKLKRPTIGIFQRGKHEGKGHFVMQEFFEKHPYVAQKFRWLYVGDGWDFIDDDKFDGDRFAVETHSDTLDYPSGYDSYYKSIDYLLVPSKWEGGPIAVLEASAKGIPVISADVGWSKEFDVDYIFETGNTKALAYLLSEEILAPMIQRRCKVHNLSYKKCAAQIVDTVSYLEGLK